MCFNSAAFDAAWFTVLSICTIGGICVLISIGIAVVYNLDVTPFDTSILAWLIVALCISTFVLSSALYLTCCNLKYGKLILAVLYTAFDLFVLFAGIAIFTLRPSILVQIGKFWTNHDQSGIVLSLEKGFDCCGFNQNAARDCGDKQTCYTALNRQLTQSSGAIGGSLLAVFVVLLVGVIISYIRALRKPPTGPDSTKSNEMVQIQEKLTHGSTIWF
jgi:hypothetical protein